MKRISFVGLVLFVVLSMAAGVYADVDKEGIKNQVDEIVVAINGGAKAEDFADAAKKEPYYVFIMEEDGKMLVHPSLVGESLKEKAEPVYNALTAATPEGLWVDYEWKGKMKHTYARKTAGGLIVASGYSD